MARTAKRRRRLWGAYSFPGFRPQPTVRGIFGDPKARVITLKRRSKKHPAAVAITSRWAGMTERSAACAIFRAATLGYLWNWRYGQSTVAGPVSVSTERLAMLDAIQDGHSEYLTLLANADRR